MPGPAAGCQGSAPAHLLALVLKAEPSPAHRARTAVWAEQIPPGGVGGNAE